MNIEKIEILEKIVGYICVALTTFIIAVFFGDLLITFVTAVFGFYFVSGSYKNE